MTYLKDEKLKISTKGDDIAILGKKRQRIQEFEESRVVAQAKCDRSIQQTMEEQDRVYKEDQYDTVSSLASYYPFADKLYQPLSNRRQRMDQLEEEKSNPLVDFRTSIEANVHANDSPMINALTFQRDGNSQTKRRSKSILLNDTTIYWIAYLQKKLYQQEKQLIIEAKNNQQRYDQTESDIKTILRRRINNRANEIADIRRDQMMKAKGLIPASLEHAIRRESREEIENRKRNEEILRSLKDLEIEKPKDLYDSVGSIWGGTSIFFYDKEQAIQQLIKDQESTIAERPPEFLKQIWDKKWDSMDFSWFQQHKHLSPSEKKKEPTPKYHEYIQAYLAQSVIAQSLPPR